MKEEISKELLILQAAEEEFLLYGYDGAKTTSIAKKAGVTHAMLHYYFRTKENLFEKVYQSKIELMGQSVIQPLTNYNGNIVDYIKSFVEAHFDFIAANPELPRFIVNELISKPERVSALSKPIGEFFGMIFPQLQKNLDDAHINGITRKVSVFDLMIDIASLNVFLFIAKPLIQRFGNIIYGNDENFLAARKKENVEIIMSRILINREQQ